MIMDDLYINTNIKEEIDIEQLPVTPYEYEWDVVMKIEVEPEPEELDASEPIHSSEPIDASEPIHVSESIDACEPTDASEPFDADSQNETVTSTCDGASNNEYLQEILNAALSKSKSTQRPKRTTKSNKTYLSIRKSKSNINKNTNDPGVDADADDKTFECSLCAEKNVKRVFKSNWQLRCHVEGIHEPPNHKCDVCSKTFGYESSLRRHRNLHSDEKGEFKFKCKICDRPLSSKQQLLLHLLQKHKIEIKDDNTTNKTRVQLFVCHICSKSFQRRKLLESHILDKHVEDSQKPFECQLCSKKFVDALSCEQHLKKQHSKLPSETEISQAIFHGAPAPVPLPKLVEEIILDMTGMKSNNNNNTGIKCSFCSKTFESSALLSVHQKVVHESSKWKCKICQKPFSNARLLRKHTLTHQETRWIQQKLKSNPKINRTLFVPTSGNARKCKLQCKFCSETVSCEQALKGHMAIYHGGDLPFKCQICGAGWISLSRLKIHLFSHTTEQRVKCKLCQMTVKHKEQLKRHTLKYHRDVKYPVDVVINRRRRNRTDTVNDNNNEIESAPEEQIQMTVDDTQAINEVQNIYLPSAPPSPSQPEITIYQTLHSNVSGFGFEIPITFSYVAQAQAQESEINNPNQITYYLEEEAAAASSVCESSTKKSRRSEIKTVIEPESNSIPNSNPTPTHSHAPIKKFECSTCPKSFISYSGLKGHMRVEHNDGEVFKCSICGSLWACKSRLDTHLLTHTTAARVKCQICFVSVKHREQLRRHMQTYHRNHLDGRNLRKKPTAVVSKYSGNVVFVCYNKKCSFEGRNQKEVALHYQEHDLPKVVLNDCCYTRPVSQTNTKFQTRLKSKAGCTKPMGIPEPTVGRKNRRCIHPLKMIRKRYKCQHCPELFCAASYLVSHMDIHSVRSSL